MGLALESYAVCPKGYSVAPSPLWHPVISLLPEAARKYCEESGRVIALDPNTSPPEAHVFFSTFGALGVFLENSPICVDTVLPGSVWGWGYTVGRTNFETRALTPCEGYLVPAPGLGKCIDSLWLSRLLNANETLRSRRLAAEATCNATHTCLQRVAKWIVRLWRSGPADNVKITQSHMAEITGFQRTSVNAACGALQDRGALRIQRGRIMVVDEDMLSRIACDCDAAVDTAWPAADRVQAPRIRQMLGR